MTRIRQALSRLKTPPKGALARWDIVTGRDSTDDPAVWAYVILEDGHADEIKPVWDRLRQDTRETVAKIAGPEIMTYVRMRLLSEDGEETAER